MKNLLLIVPPYISFESFKSPLFTERNNALVTDMPLGVLSLSAYARKYAEADVRIIDFNPILYKLESDQWISFDKLYQNQLSKLADSGWQPELIGISALFTAAFRNSADCAAACQQLFPEAITFSGGGVPTSLWKYILNNYDCFDALSYGEGERPIAALMNSKDPNKFLEESGSWITKKKILNDPSFEPQHEWIFELDEIPRYDYDLINPEDYAVAPIAATYTSHNDEVKPIYNMATSRGCPYKCTFCASHDVHGYQMRYHSLERMKEDILWLKKNLGMERIAIQDDHFMGDHKRAKEIIKFIRDEKIKVFFQSGVTMFSLTRDMLELMVSAGITELVLPIESGSARVAKELMKKGHVNRKIIDRVTRDCTELEIQMDANLIIGMPGETMDDINEGILYLKTLDVNWFRIYVATPLPGSELFDQCMDEGFIDLEDSIGSDFKRARITTNDFTPEDIERKAYEMNLELNFINNADMRYHRYEKAFSAFQNVINITDNHAFAYYSAAQALKKLSRIAAFNEYAQKYNDIINTSEYWSSYASKFGLSLRLDILKTSANNKDETNDLLEVYSPVSGMLTQASTYN